ncbi:MAG: undecaprenyldiphospho-muramoylpentapeptide beta-N-acetylglucosaminyltransferase, partial [Alphaproteobacteria bacterium]|nr:undecaprenyldiphospho-muramoylpentapeptide beta-N-acetylglucosaminyltransferase [Alphaproteobacteria bacterium]
MPGLALLSAGGTGGHLFPAEALATVLKRRGWRVHLATDHRVDTHARDFPAEEIHVIPSGTFGKDPVSFARALRDLARGYLKARRTVAAIRPQVAVGFGGYPTVPPMLAASRFGIPTVIHDQNAVIGRANKFLASRVTAIATGFPKVKGAEMFVAKTVETGSPVRESVRRAAGTPYPGRAAGEPFRLLVFGGSQGARFMSDLVPPAIAVLPEATRRSLRITQQCRPEDMDRVREAYAQMGVEAALQPFFDDMPARIAAAHLVVSRSGASTVAELSVIGRPAIMVPLPHALDQDQKANAEVLARAGGGWMIEQRDMSPERLAGDLADLVADPGRLAKAAAAAQLIGRPDAAEKLADLVE